MNWQVALTRKSQPSGLPGWRRVTSTPIPALGTPIAAAITKLATWSDSTLSGTAAAKDSSARRPRTTLQVLACPRRKLMGRTLRGDRSVNVTGRREPAVHLPVSGGRRSGKSTIPATGWQYRTGRETNDRDHRGRASVRYSPEGAADQPGSALVRDDRGDRGRPGGGPLVLPGRRGRGHRRQVHLRLRHGGQRRRVRQGGPVRLDGPLAGHARQGISAEC